MIGASCLAGCSDGGGSGRTDSSAGFATEAVSTEPACAAAMRAVDRVQAAMDLSDATTDLTLVIDDAETAARRAAADQLATHLADLGEQIAISRNTSESLDVRSRAARAGTRLDIPSVCADLGAPFVRTTGTTVGAG